MRVDEGLSRIVSGNSVTMTSLSLCSLSNFHTLWTKPQRRDPSGADRTPSFLQELYLDDASDLPERPRPGHRRPRRPWRAPQESRALSLIHANPSPLLPPSCARLTFLSPITYPTDLPSPLCPNQSSPPPAFAHSHSAPVRLRRLFPGTRFLIP